MPKYGDAPVIREGGIDDPDRYKWPCDLDKCKKCRERYVKWKAAFDAEQKQLKEKNHG